MIHSHNDISLFAPGFPVLVSLGDLIPGIAPVDDRFYLAGLNKLLEENEIFALVLCELKEHFLGAYP